MVVKGSFFGMGYLPKDFEEITESAVAPYIIPYKENSFIRTLLNAHFNTYPDQIKHLL
jgi:DNA polymerase-3 subunit epsilon